MKPMITEFGIHVFGDSEQGLCFSVPVSPKEKYCLRSILK